jgi:hypothetical protein
MRHHFHNMSCRQGSKIEVRARVSGVMEHAYFASLARACRHPIRSRFSIMRRAGLSGGCYFLDRLDYREGAARPRAEPLLWKSLKVDPRMPAIHNHLCALPQGDDSVRPTLTSGIVGRKRHLEILDFGQVLHDARTVIGPRIDAVGEVGAVFMMDRLSRVNVQGQFVPTIGTNLLWEVNAWPMPKRIWLHTTTESMPAR